MDPSLRPFLSSPYSPTDYLNATLPSVKQQQPAPSLAAIASQTQTHVSTLNALTTRFSATLTDLTDDILRTSSRLAYEVELLRGEALSLADSLSSRGELHESILKFVPGGLDHSDQGPETALTPSKARHNSQNMDSSHASTVQQQSGDENSRSSIREPEALVKLRTLLHVRAQLQAVIQRFNLALSFPIPPSFLATTASSLISVNAPNQDPDLESKGQAALSRFRAEVTEILADVDGRGDSTERAKERVWELRELCTIWKGTGEERARNKWVDGLDQMIDDEAKKKQERQTKGGRVGQEAKRDTSTARSAVDSTGSGPGFLRRLREEIYMD